METNQDGRGDAPLTVRGALMELNALALEYQGDYGTAWRNLNIANLVNNPAASGKCSVFGLSFAEEPFDVRFGQLGSLRDDRTEAALITQDIV